MDPSLTLRIHGSLDRSYANGPGPRAVLWVQGCSIRCPGCFNSEAQPTDGGREVFVMDIMRWIRSIPAIDGFTLSGGEPLDQTEAVGALLHEIRRTTGLSILLFTGYSWNRIVQTPRFLAAASLCDVVVAGPFELRRLPGRGLRSSANQTLHLVTDRYSWSDVNQVPGLEVVIGDRRTIATGVIDADLS